MAAEKYYGLSLELVDLTSEFGESVGLALKDGVPPPILINDVARDTDDMGVLDVIQKHLQNRIVDEELNNAPICSVDCPAPITKDYNLGVNCPTCGHKVSQRKMTSEIWLEAHEEVGTYVNPRFWMLFSKYFGNLMLKKFERNNVTMTRGNDIMAWMVDPTYQPEAMAKSGRSRFKFVANLLSEYGYVRDVNYFRSNFRTVMGILTEYGNWHRIMNTANTKREDAKVKHAKSERDRLDWERFVSMYSGVVFTRYIPLLSPMLIVAEEFESRITVDPVYSAQLDSAKTIGSIYTHIRPLKARDVIGRSMRANRQLAYFYVDYRREQSSQKTGTYRGKNSSTFIPFSGRATITPITEPHDPYNMDGPWRWTINLFAIHFENKLRRRGYSPKEIHRIMDYGCMQYDAILEEIFYELVKESPGGKGLKVVPLRNPTLVQLSVETLYINRIITDVNQCSLRISVLVIKQMNADFDGDQLMVYAPADSVEMDMADALLPEHGIISASNPNEVAGGMVLHNELISIQNRYIQDDEEDNMSGTGL